MGAPRLASRLEELLKERGLNGKQLIEMAGVSERTVSNLRRNTFRMVEAETAGRICQALNITPGDLFTLENGSQ